jgi:hypothetical protein
MDFLRGNHGQKTVAGVVFFETRLKKIRRFSIYLHHYFLNLEFKA